MTASLRGSNALTLVTCLALSIGACSEAKFGGEFGANTDKKEDAGDSKPAVNSDDADTAVEACDPAMVSGSYLTCMEDPSLQPLDLDHTGVGCTVHDKTGAKLQVSGDVTWAVFNDDAPLSEAVFTNQEADNFYHVLTSLPKKDLAALRVQAAIVGFPTLNAKITLYSQAPTLTPAATSTNTVESPTSGPSQTVQINVLGTSTDFHLGDDRWDPMINSDCSGSFGSKLQKIEISGKQLSIPFSVEGSTAHIEIAFDDLCGINYESNVVEILQGSAVILKRKLEVRANQFIIPSFHANAGDFTLRITSKKLSSFDTERDDIVVGKITFRTSGTMSLGAVGSN